MLNTNDQGVGQDTGVWSNQHSKKNWHADALPQQRNAGRLKSARVSRRSPRMRVEEEGKFKIRDLRSLWNNLKICRGLKRGSSALAGPARLDKSFNFCCEIVDCLLATTLRNAGVTFVA